MKLFFLHQGLCDYKVVLVFVEIKANQLFALIYKNTNIAILRNTKLDVLRLL